MNEFLGLIREPESYEMSLVRVIAGKITLNHNHVKFYQFSNGSSLREVDFIDSPRKPLKIDSERERCEYCRNYLKGSICENDCKKIMESDEYLLNNMRRYYTIKIRGINTVLG